MAVANIIETSDPRSFSFLAFPEQNPLNYQYIQDQFNNISDTLIGAGREFIEASKEIYDRVNSNEALRAAKAALRLSKGIIHSNIIQPLNNLNEIRSAGPIMQRYIMAEPVIRKAYHKQRIDGYSDTYIDLEPKEVGENHYDYRRVMDGMVVIEDDGWVATTYCLDDRGEEELTIDEKVDIINVWDLARAYFESGEDPTDIYS